MEICKVSHLNKIYGGKVLNKALSDINLTIRKGEFIGIMGPSGSGKTTLLNMISTIDKPSSGEVIINGKDPHSLKRSELALFRRRALGFVFQDFNLLDTLTIEENIVLPFVLDKKRLEVMVRNLMAVAKQLDIVDILKKRTYEVSGGQIQRAAIARAIIHSPSLLLADEPTGNLDSKSARTVMEMLESINKTDDTTMMLVTHDPLAASYCHRVVFIKDGKLESQIYRGHNRQQFFQEIIDMLSLLGGNAHELSSVRAK
ncbi:putative ABC transport system ATP-binding protein [Marininema mesophilum]|uniref:Putative ABC transport system ATP-binding protein n=1 Tax=Marininema mesophilum TaxID=1048340 RepID=A0A1H2Z3X8_9BACL|nr:ABC transporter ATP-binding protein [Marininema mesophilum]SDX12025.1 putative ABC transport system ATP-binding protein [Marininema mesophilum]